MVYRAIKDVIRSDLEKSRDRLVRNIKKNLSTDDVSIGDAIDYVNDIIDHLLDEVEDR